MNIVINPSSGIGRCILCHKVTPLKIGWNSALLNVTNVETMNIAIYSDDIQTEAPQLPHLLQ